MTQDKGLTDEEIDRIAEEAGALPQEIKDALRSLPKTPTFEQVWEAMNGRPYQPERMTFGEAIAHMKRGKKCARAGWNGKGMWVAYLPPVTYEAKMVNARVKALIGPDEDLRCNAYFVMWTADKRWQIGWLASQSDMDAEDWQVVG